MIRLINKFFEETGIMAGGIILSVIIAIPFFLILGIAIKLINLLPIYDGYRMAIIIIFFIVEAGATFFGLPFLAIRSIKKERELKTI